MRRKHWDFQLELISSNNGFWKIENVPWPTYLAVEKRLQFIIGAISKGSGRKITILSNT